MVPSKTLSEVSLLGALAGAAFRVVLFVRLLGGAFAGFFGLCFAATGFLTS
jgi:hypothetical protein